MALMVTVKVVPSAGRQSCILDKSGGLKCFLKNPAERGLANNELIKLLAQAAAVPQNSVIIISGQTSRTKRIKIESTLTLEALMLRLGIELQQSFINHKK